MSDEFADVAARAVEAGGDYLADRFAAAETDAEYTDQDVKTRADREAEQRVLEVVREAYPDHAVSTEESGEHDGTDYRWVVDPLDGTNNFAAGIPTFGVAASVCEDGGDDALATAVSVPVTGDTYVATREGGVRFNGRPVRVEDGDHRALATGTVGMIIGDPVLAGGRPRRAWDAVTESVEATCKRAVQTWAPVVYWGLFARGRLDGFRLLLPRRARATGGRTARPRGRRRRALRGAAHCVRRRRRDPRRAVEGRDRRPRAR